MHYSCGGRTRESSGEGHLDRKVLAMGWEGVSGGGVYGCSYCSSRPKLTQQASSLSKKVGVANMCTPSPLP
jgi:uncharacterized metal-binding protein